MPDFSEKTRVRTKSQMYQMLEGGQFGNRFQIWHNAEDLRCAVLEGYEGLIGVRCSDRPGMPYYHHKTPEESLVLGRSLERLGLHPVYYEASPDQWITLQGELQRLAGGLYLRYSTMKTHMRAALRYDHHVIGIEANVLLDQCLFPASCDEINQLLDYYPDCVVEFTCYEVPVGILRGRNHVCWECRNY